MRRRSRPQYPFGALHYGVVIAFASWVEETLLQFQLPVHGPDGTAYAARACGAQMADGLWHGWLEFEPVDDGEPIRSQRETTQPNRTDTEYWASGLTPVYLEGALRRALDGPLRIPSVVVRPPSYRTPAPSAVVEPSGGDGHIRSVLDPFSVYAKSEALLRSQLRALAAWHLVNIVAEYGLSDEPIETLNAVPRATLIETIVQGVRTRSTVSRSR